MIGGGKGRRLVLHFDVNKTIVMKDSSQDLTSVTLTVCGILANICWGKLVTKKVGDKEELQWVLSYDQLSEQKPELDPEDQEPVVSFKQYLDTYFPIKKQWQIPDDNERERANQENEVIRSTKLLNFAKPGNPGAKFKGVFEKMTKTLTLPKAAKEELGITDDTVQPLSSAKAGSQAELGQAKNTEGEERKETTQMSNAHYTDEDDQKQSLLKDKRTEEEKKQDEFQIMMSMFGEGKYHLIPTFFRTLIYLKKAKREFGIVFRTFGSDLNNVIFEFNKFCNGDHPCYSGRGGTPQVKFDGSKGTKDLRIKEKYQNGLYYRDGEGLNEAKLVTGSLRRNSQQETSIEEFYSGEIEEGVVNVYRDAVDHYVAIMETMKKRSSMAIQDDFQFWKNTNFEIRGGKLLLVDQADYGSQHIFFDDNAGVEVDCNIDVKDIVSNETVSYKKFINKYVVKVEPHRAILEPDYFIKMIEMAEQKRDEEIERIEQGLESEDDGTRNQDQENEWEKLQKLSNEEYLMKTVLPVLYQGMKVIDLERPEAPLEYLALYLLKHQDQIKLPPKPQNATH